MTFTCRGYFDEVIGLKHADPELRAFCLKVSLPTVNKRLAECVIKVEGTEAEWIARRNIECGHEHRDPHFDQPIDTENRPAVEVAEEIGSDYSS